MRKVRLTFLISPFLWIWQIWCLQSSEFVGILPRYLCIFLTAAWLPILGRCLNLMILMDRDGSRNLLGKKMRYCIYIVLYFFYLQSDIYNLTSHHTINIKFQFYWLLGLMPYLEARTLLHRMSTRLSTYCGRIHFVQNHHRIQGKDSILHNKDMSTRVQLQIFYSSNRHQCNISPSPIWFLAFKEESYLKSNFKLYF